VDGEFDATLRRFEARLADAHPAKFVLTLYVAGASDLSGRAIAHVRALCEDHLFGRFELSVVDVHREVALTHLRNVLATPTLIKELPLPTQRLVGDLSDTRAVLAAFGIDARDFSAKAVVGDDATG
jgi:circadian clock protein KaiB